MNMRALPFGAVALGAFLGLMASPASYLFTGSAFEVYDHLAPVVTAQVTLLDRRDTYLEFALRGQKHRQCTYVGINAYMHAGDATFDAFLDRTDKPENGATRPADGRVLDMGRWRVQPLRGASRMTLVMQHQCSGRLVLTEIGAIDL